jgi:hypothetical protein
VIDPEGRTGSAAELAVPRVESFSTGKIYM